MRSDGPAEQALARKTTITWDKVRLIMAVKTRTLAGDRVEPLGPGQEDVPPTARRLLLQLFLRSAAPVFLPGAGTG